MMRSILRRFYLIALLLLTALLNTSCIFGAFLDIFAGEVVEGRRLLSFSTTSEMSTCGRGDDGSFSCLYFYRQTEQSRSSIFGLEGYNGEDGLLALLDPVVLQLPEAASDFRGSFLHPSGAEGDLVITSGLATLRADATQSYQAEPGMQLVVFDLPSGSPTSGVYSYNVNFTVPGDLSTLQLKALFTGRVEVGGESYYLPLLPCTAELAEVPAISVPLPDGGVVPLPTNVQGCDDVTYTLAGETVDMKLFLPFAKP